MAINHVWLFTFGLIYKGSNNHMLLFPFVLIYKWSNNHALLFTFALINKESNNYVLLLAFGLIYKGSNDHKLLFIFCLIYKGQISFNVDTSLGVQFPPLEHKGRILNSARAPQHWRGSTFVNATNTRVVFPFVYLRELNVH